MAAKNRDKKDELASYDGIFAMFMRMTYQFDLPFFAALASRLPSIMGQLKSLGSRLEVGMSGSGGQKRSKTEVS